MVDDPRNANPIPPDKQPGTPADAGEETQLVFLIRTFIAVVNHLGPVSTVLLFILGLVLLVAISQVLKVESVLVYFVLAPIFLVVYVVVQILVNSIIAQAETDKNHLKLLDRYILGFILTTFASMVVLIIASLFFGWPVDLRDMLMPTMR